MRRKSFTQEQIDEILKAEKEAGNKFEIKRLLVLRLRAIESMSSKEIAKVVGYPAVLAGTPPAGRRSGQVPGTLFFFNNSTFSPSGQYLQLLPIT